MRRSTTNYYYYYYYYYIKVYFTKIAIYRVIN